MRSTLACLIAVVALASCKGSSTPTSAPVVSAATGVEGAWSGYLSNYPGGGGTILVTLHESADSISGVGSWGADFAIAGNRADSTVGFTATQTTNAFNQWSVSGVLSGNLITGTMSFKTSSYPVTFSRH